MIRGLGKVGNDAPPTKKGDEGIIYQVVRVEPAPEPPAPAEPDPVLPAAVPEPEPEPELLESEAPGPLALFRKIPAKIRWYAYSVVASAVAVEGVLDLANVGLVPDKTQTVALGILSLFGFTMAAANTGGAR